MEASIANHVRSVKEIVGLLYEEGGDVVKRIPTQRGDVLILSTAETFTIYAVGLVTRAGQQEFEAHMHVTHQKDRAAAVTAARVLARPGRRIFLLNIDNDVWSEI